MMISIIVPVYNDSSGLRATLRSLVKLEHPESEYEIIIADNGSTDSTEEVSSSFQKKYPGLIKITCEKSIRSSYAARNKGIGIAKGSIVAFIDSDMIVDSNWLKKIKDSFGINKIDYLGYEVKMVLEKKDIFSLYNAVTGFPINRYIKNDNFCPTCCLVVKSEVFDKAGLFDHRLVSGGDNVFGKRVHASGLKQFYDPDIYIKHPAYISLIKSYKRWFRSGRGSFQKYYYYPGYFSHLNIKLYNPFNYLPPRPSRFIKTVENSYIWKNLSFGTRVFLYFIHWVVKLTRMIGYIYEKARK